MYYGYTANRKTLIDSVDKQLLLAAVTIEQLIPSDFIDRCIKGQEISTEEKRSVMQAVLTLCDNSDMTYLYIVVHDEAEDKYILVLATGEATPEEPEKGINVEYTNPWIGIVQTLRDGETRFTEGYDDYGYARGAFLRRTTVGGRYYLLGADLQIDHVVRMKRNAFLTFLGISIFSFCAVVVTGSLLARRISEPIRKLSAYTVRLVSSNFSRDVRMPPEMLDSPKRSQNECVLLAVDIDLMQSKLASYLDDLQTMTTAKERAESELRIAGDIQKSFLPEKPPENERVDLAAILVPALHAAGDLYDYAPMEDGRIFFALGDVSGKGMPAALFMSMVLTLIRAGLRRGLPLPEMMGWINDSLAASNPECTFVTLILGTFDPETGDVFYCNGGHNPPLLQSTNGGVSYLPKAKNPIVGVIPELEFELRSLRLRPGDRLILYTDGVTEAMAVGDSLFGEDRCAETVAALDSELSSQKVLDELLHAVQDFSRGRSQSDDITILCLRRIL